MIIANLAIRSVINELERIVGYIIKLALICFPFLSSSSFAIRRKKKLPPKYAKNNTSTRSRLIPRHELANQSINLIRRHQTTEKKRREIIIFAHPSRPQLVLNRGHPPTQRRQRREEGRTRRDTSARGKRRRSRRNSIFSPPRLLRFPSRGIPLDSSPSRRRASRARRAAPPCLRRSALPSPQVRRLVGFAFFCVRFGRRQIPAPCLVSVS